MFLISSLVDDCIGRGRTINNGGAVYEDFGSTPLGISNAADSLTAIRIAVYQEQFISPGELVNALRCNFRDNEPLRRRLRNLPKYGQGHPEADAMMHRLVENTCAIYAQRKNILGGKFKPMIMTFMMAPVEGRKLGALPDGRPAGDPIAHGIMPQTSSMTAGIGQAMLSAVSVPVELFSGGASHMWDIDPSLAGPARLRALVETFFQQGGQMFQGNILAISKP